eukprot:1157233-Pelagomonas_calceolata.AAC.4
MAARFSRGRHTSYAYTRQVAVIMQTHTRHIMTQAHISIWWPYDAGTHTCAHQSMWGQDCWTLVMADTGHHLGHSHSDVDTLNDGHC